MSISKRLAEIVDRYDNFIMDIWGVIHDGKDVLPCAKEFVSYLNSQGKFFCFLSNSPRPSEVVYKKFQELGVSPVEPSQVISSGEFFLNDIKSGKSKIFKPTGPIYVYGENYHKELIEKFDLPRTNNLSEAVAFLFLAFTDTEEEHKQHEAFLREAMKHEVPMLCVNPDKIVMHGDSKRTCQGYYAAYYAGLEQTVYYYGKPHPEIFRYVLEKYGLDRKRTLMIGDSLSTDVAGAESVGIDSLFLLCGIHKDEVDVAKLLNSHTTMPRYIGKDLGIDNEVKTA